MEPGYEKNLANFFKEMANFQEKLMKGMQNLTRVEDIDTATTAKELVYKEDKVQLFHYQPEQVKYPIPVMVVYALVNRQYMMDLQEDRSLFKNLLREGMDLYVIDWGYPSKPDKFTTMEDYIYGYMDNCVDFLRKKTGRKKINLLGVCQGGTFSAIYASLFPQKIQNLILMVAPVDFDTRDGLLNVWAKAMDVDLMVDVMGNIPGDFMNLGFLWLKPFQLILDKYVGLLDNIGDENVVRNFLRMEKWIFDSPDQAGEAFRKFVKELYRDNKLMKGEFYLGKRKIDLKNIKMPVLNIYGEQDHLVPPSCSRPFKNLVGTKDITDLNYPVGHIGMYVSGKTQRDLAPSVAKWLSERLPAPLGKKTSKKEKARTAK